MIPDLTREVVGVMVTHHDHYLIGEDEVQSIQEVFYGDNPFIRVSFNDGTEIEFSRNKVLAVMYKRKLLLEEKDEG